MMRLWCLVATILTIQSACVAGTNDFWQVMTRACDSNGNWAQLNSECGTKATAQDGLDSFDQSTGGVNQSCAWIACYDLGPGAGGNGYSKDYRAPIAAATTWNLKLRLGSSWAASQVFLRLWNPSGPTDINGTVPISLKVAADPTGTYSTGQLLIPSWDPNLNGTQISPAYTITFNNASALVSGAAIELQLIAGTVSETVCSIGEARGVYAGQTVRLNGITAASGNEDAPGLWVSSEGLPGLRVPASLGVAGGEVVDLSGVVVWTDGVPVLTNAQLKGRDGMADPLSHAMSLSALANDRRESLSYSGINPVGLPCTVCGEVTASDAGSGYFYVDDGSGLADGLGPPEAPYSGIRVTCAGITPPGLPASVRVSGIRSVEKHVLARNAIVNGEQRSTGETLYVPVILVRDAADIHAILP
jgi:hypothetical protein